MHLHPPTERIDSIKQFLLHLVMIVLGIVIALSLEQWRESLHHKAIAERALYEITQEMEKNQALVRKNLPTYEKITTHVESVLAAQKAAIKAYESKSGPVPEPKDIDGDIGVLGLQSTAWNMANINQALSYMPHETAVKLSRIYNAQIMITGLHSNSLQMLLGVLALGDFPVNAPLPEMKEQLKALNQAKTLFKSQFNNYKILDQQYAEFLGTPVAAPPALRASQ
jgi:hypothetical protein